MILSSVFGTAIVPYQLTRVQTLHMDIAMFLAVECVEILIRTLLFTWQHEMIIAYRFFTSEMQRDHRISVNLLLYIL